jgi:hypothetical protein
MASAPGENKCAWRKQVRLAKKGGSMQIIWMVLVTLVLALTGILGLALVTRIAASARRRDPQPKP